MNGRHRRSAIVAALALTSALRASAADAQEPAGYATNTFEPSDRGSRWFVLDALDIQGNGRIALGVVNDYSYRSLVSYASDGSVASSLVRNQFFWHFGASVVLVERVRLGANVPLQLFADGSTTTIDGVVHRPPEDVAVGDLRSTVDVRIFGKYGDRATLALGTALFVPSGSTAAYTGDGEPRVLPRVSFAGQTDVLAYAATLGALVRGREEDFGSGRVGSAVTAGVSAGLRFANGRVLVGPELFASTVVARAFEARTTPLEALLGTHIDLGSDTRIGAGVGTSFSRAYGAPVFRALVSIEWVPSDPKVEEAEDTAAEKKEDRDGDGVPDAEDACGFVPGRLSDQPELHGCPPPDSDGDGVVDPDDKCPAAAGNGAADGCPAAAPVEEAPPPAPPEPRDEQQQQQQQQQQGSER